MGSLRELQLEMAAPQQPAAGNLTMVAPENRRPMADPERFQPFQLHQEVPIDAC